MVHVRCLSSVEVELGAGARRTHDRSQTPNPSRPMVIGNVAAPIRLLRRGIERKDRETIRVRRGPCDAGRQGLHWRTAGGYHGMISPEGQSCQCRRIESGMLKRAHKGTFHKLSRSIGNAPPSLPASTTSRNSRPDARRARVPSSRNLVYRDLGRQRAFLRLRGVGAALFDGGQLLLRRLWRCTRKIQRALASLCIFQRVDAFTSRDTKPRSDKAIEVIAPCHIL